MRRNLMIVAAVAVATVWCGQAAAQAAPVNPFDPAPINRGLDQLGGMIADQMFSRFDVNRDGWLTRDEAVKASEFMTGHAGSGADPRAWRAMDLDGDGRIARGEMRAAFVALRRRMAVGGRPF